MIAKLIFTLVLSSPIFFCFIDTVLADGTPPSAPIDQPSSAIKAIVQNGVVEYIKGVKKARISLEWNPLPVNENLVESLIQYKKVDSFPEEINQNNTRNVACGLISQDILYEALGVIKNSSCDRLDTDKKLQERELDTLFSVGGISPAEYIAMSRERTILRTILTSKGIEYAFNFTNNGEIEVPDFKDKDITWQIKIYKNIWPSAPSDIYYYRFSIKAIVKPFDENVLSNNQQVAFNARIRIKDLEKQTSIPNRFFSVTNTSTIIPKLINPPDTTKIASEAAKNFTNLSGVFNIVGGGSQIGAATQGLLGGTENSSFISGGLLDFTNGGVDPLIGVSQEIGKIGDIGTGVVFGVGLGEKTSIFLGPSLQTSIFTLSAGATLGAKKQSDVNFAGLISVDLSRLTGSKTDVNTIKVDNPSVGDPSNIRKEIDDTTSSNTLMRYKINSKSSQNISFDLVLVCDKYGKKISTPTTRQPINKSSGIVYLEKGVYGYKVRKGLSISRLAANASLSVKADSPVDLRENIPQGFTWEINESVNSEGINPEVECSSK